MLLNLDSVPRFYKGYVKLVEETDPIQALRISGNRAQELAHTIPADRQDFKYAPGKWTVRELLCHMIDSERVFAYRALCFARNDKTPLPGFDEQAYAPESNAQGRELKDIMAEMAHLRTTTIDLFASFSNDMLSRNGVANENGFSVASLGFIIAGHETHHVNILKERYISAWS
ncbi:MAG TPA: DinB family protein [Cyclobacteriaceae bacterium]|nr:DinB family protein [Cyclobacteriaceae bacterium]